MFCPHSREQSEALVFWLTNEITPPSPMATLAPGGPSHLARLETKQHVPCVKLALSRANRGTRVPAWHSLALLGTVGTRHGCHGGRTGSTRLSHLLVVNLTLGLHADGREWTRTRHRLALSLLRFRPAARPCALVQNRSPFGDMIGRHQLDQPSGEGDGGEHARSDRI